MNASETVEGGQDVLAEGLRFILAKHFAQGVTLDRVLPGDQACILKHADGTRGVVPVASVVMLGAA